MLDADVIFINDILELWKHFDKMQRAGLALSAEITDWKEKQRNAYNFLLNDTGLLQAKNTFHILLAEEYFLQKKPTQAYEWSFNDLGNPL